MMSYTMAWTALWSSGSTLMRRTSPCTRIIGGRPDDRCKSEALFLTENASSWVMSMGPAMGATTVVVDAGASGRAEHHRASRALGARAAGYSRQIMAMMADNVQQVL